LSAWFKTEFMQIRDINNTMEESNSSDRKNHKHSKSRHTFHEMKRAQIRF